MKSKNVYNKHNNIDKGKPLRPHPYTKNYKQLRNAVSGRNSLSWRRATPMGYLIPSTHP